MNKSCKQCSAWRLGQCNECEYFTGVYPAAANWDEHKKSAKKRRPANISYKKYGLTTEQREKLLLDQNKQCAICCEHLKYPQLDHDHLTMQARGYLCQRCNSMLAGIDSAWFKAAAEKYLANPPGEKFYT